MTDSARLKQAAARKGSEHQRLQAQGLAYVAFALKYPGQFQMMFSNKRLIADDERLSRRASRPRIRIRYRRRRFDRPGAARQHQSGRRSSSTVAWSTVHGFAKLALEGKFGAAGTEAGRREIMAMLQQVLEYLWPTDAKRDHVPRQR